MEILNTLNEYANLINFVLLIAVVGFLFKLTLFYKEAIKEKHKAEIEKYKTKISSISERLEFSENKLKIHGEISKQQIEATKADLERTSKWHDKEITELRRELSELLGNEGLTKEQLVMNIDTTSLTTEIKAAVEDVLKQITAIQNDIVTNDHSVINDPSFYLDLAQGYASSNQWIKAAENYEKYNALFPKDWEVHFLRAVSYVNTRKGNETNLIAFRAYNEAITFLPINIDLNMKARLFAYRGAVAKRLKRFDEAEADLLLAQKYATADYEVYDIIYNLSAVYAMQGKREKTFEMVSKLIGRPEINNIRAHLDDYFSKFSKDLEFMELIR